MAKVLDEVSTNSNRPNLSDTHQRALHAYAVAESGSYWASVAIPDTSLKWFDITVTRSRARQMALSILRSAKKRFSLSSNLQCCFSAIRTLGRLWVTLLQLLGCQNVLYSVIFSSRLEFAVKQRALPGRPSTRQKSVMASKSCGYGIWSCYWHPSRVHFIHHLRHFPFLFFNPISWP